MTVNYRPGTKRKALIAFAGLGILGAVGAGWYGVKTERPRAAAVLDSKPDQSAPSRSVDLATGELLKAWFEKADTLTRGRGKETAAITITSAESPARREAFQSLLDALNRGNAWELYESLAGAEGKAGELSEAEWTAFLRKWGSLDPDALERISDRPEIGWRTPSLLYGVASIDPVAALAWLEQKAPVGQPPQWRTAALRDLMLGWTMRNFEEPAEWIRGHLDDPALDEVIAAYAKGRTAGDPEAAFAWANAVEGAWRAHARECIAKEWLAAAPAKATTKLLEAGYRQDELDQFVTDRDGIDITISGAEAGGMHLGE
jgi:hypothetical protein